MLGHLQFSSWIPDYGHQPNCSSHPPAWVLFQVLNMSLTVQKQEIQPPSMLHKACWTHPFSRQLSLVCGYLSPQLHHSFFLNITQPREHHTIPGCLEYSQLQLLGRYGCLPLGDNGRGSRVCRLKYLYLVSIKMEGHFHRKHGRAH